MIYYRKCIECEKEFATDSKQLKTCSDECRKKRLNRAAYEHTKSVRADEKQIELDKEKTCEFCGTIFHSPRKNQIYCSVSCSKKVKYKAEAEKRKSIKPVTKKKAKVKSLSELAREAREHGMDYGSYIVWLEGRTI